jgi:hypothetical protein
VAVWKRKCGGAEIVIHNADHLPPHCHVLLRGTHLKIEILNLEVIKPGGAAVKPALMKCLRRYQSEMLQAWGNVTLLPGASS